MYRTKPSAQCLYLDLFSTEQNVQVSAGFGGMKMIVAMQFGQ